MMRAGSPDATGARWRREYQVSLGLALMWTGVVALWLQAGLLDGRLDLGGLLFRTALVLAIWCLSIHSIRFREAAHEPLAELEALPAGDFAAWVAARLQERGYSKVTRTGGYRGVDLIAEAPGEMAVVQCRRFVAWPVGTPALRDLYTAMRDLGADRAYLATTGRMTRAAERWAADKPLAVWDAHCLARLASGTAPEHEFRGAAGCPAALAGPPRPPAPAHTPAADATMARPG